jgi:hypothetical protein
MGERGEPHGKSFGAEMGYTLFLRGRTMRRIFAGSLALAVRSAVPIVAMLACSCGTHGFVAVLIDAVSKKPVPSARLILAPKKEGKHECTIDTSLTAVSNDRGEVRIPNVGPGEYVVFYNLSGSLKPELKGKVVVYGGFANALARSLCPCTVTRAGAMVTFDGDLSIANGGFESTQFGIRMNTTSEGALLTVRAPSAGSAPAKIEIVAD